MTNKIITVQEASKYLRINSVTLCRLCRKGQIPASKVGRQWRFRQSSLDNWLDHQESKNKK